MNRTELVSKFAETVGIEKAESVVDEAMATIGIEGPSMTNMDARDICEVIHHEHDGYITLVASELRVQLAAQERFAALLENIPDPAVVVTFNQREPYVRSVNDAFENEFGHMREDAIGAPLLSLISTPDQASADIVANWWRETGQSEQEVTRVTATGEARTYLFRSVIVAREGGEVEGYGIYTDITERKRREQQLQHQNERLDEFVSIVSHDLRNPLSVAASHAELLAETVGDESAMTSLDAIKRSHDRMGRLLEDLLDLARQGQVVGEPESVAIGEIAAAAWQQVDTTDATLSVDADVTAEGDPDRIQQLFENLYRNSIEHAGSDISVAVGTLGPTGQNGFYIEDDGPGIPEDDREQVFQHGYTTVTKGTGFGLSIVESIVEAHGWTVGVTEGETSGARFEVRW
ncbi:sensor histidine kinase [Haloarcula amylovorans]|uniref:sensor histidine kinase n=1 Tax=Haloarcula amylovorans TaxID=2562280 RepID=UPI0010768758|nr:PAS domain-containing sensor histidine kinase [Halomicroarcula amylolytica]